MNLAPWVTGVRHGLHLRPQEIGGGIKRQVASRCAWLWRKGWVSRRQAETIKRACCATLGSLQ